MHEIHEKGRSERGVGLVLFHEVSSFRIVEPMEIPARMEMVLEEFRVFSSVVKNSHDAEKLFEIGTAGSFSTLRVDFPDEA